MEEDEFIFYPWIGDVVKDIPVIFKVKEELQKESDRGCCLVAAAYIEMELKKIISDFLIEMSKKELDDFFSFTGIAGTFSSKLKLAYSLGLISKEICTSTNQLRTVRNMAAHLEKPFDFNESRIKNHIQNIIPSLNKSCITIREEFIEKIIVIISTLHYNRSIGSIFRRKLQKDKLVEIKENIEEQKIHLTALIVIERSAHDLTYEEALQLVKDMKNIII